MESLSMSGENMSLKAAEKSQDGADETWRGSSFPARACSGSHILAISWARIPQLQGCENGHLIVYFFRHPLCVKLYLTDKRSDTGNPILRILALKYDTWWNLFV